MEELIAEIEAYAVGVGLSPSTVIQRARVGSGSTWRRWRDGEGTPTLATVARLKAYIAANPAPEAKLFLINADDDGQPMLFINTAEFGIPYVRVTLAPSDIGVINKIHFDHLHWKRLRDDPSYTFAGKNAP